MQVRENVKQNIDLDNTFQDDLNPKGVYRTSKHRNSSTRYFDKSPRQSIINKASLKVPGPGQQ